MEAVFNNQCIMFKKLSRAQAATLKSIGFSTQLNDKSILIAPINQSTITALKGVMFNSFETLSLIDRYQNFLDQINKAKKYAQRFKTEVIKLGFKPIGIPYEHQAKALPFAMSLPYCALFLDTGLGKTYVITQLLNYRFKAKAIKKVLIIAPLSILSTVWESELKKFSPDLKVLNWYKPKGFYSNPKCPICEKRLKTISNTHKCFRLLGSKNSIMIKYPELNNRFKYISSDNQVFLINPEGYKSVNNVIKQNDFDMIVIDESTIMRSRDTEITSILLSSAYKFQYRIVMSGCPTPNSVEEYWPQLSFLSYDLGNKFGDFRDKFTEPNKVFYISDRRIESDWRLKPSKLKEFCSIIEPLQIVFKKKEVLDLPRRTITHRLLEMSALQKKLYIDMAKDLVIILQDETLSVPTKLASLAKLTQIAAGFIYAKDKKPIVLDGNPKMKELDNIMLEIDDKVIVWGQHRFIIESIEKRFAKYNPVKIYGNMNQKTIKANSDRFINDPTCKMMIANPKCAKYGHTWTVAPYSVFFSVGWSWEDVYQAGDRNYRISQDKNVFMIFLLMKDSIDVIQERLLFGHKKKITDLLFSKKGVKKLIEQLEVNE